MFSKESLGTKSESKTNEVTKALQSIASFHDRNPCKAKIKVVTTVLPNTKRGVREK